MKTKTVINRLYKPVLDDVRKMAKKEPKSASILLSKKSTIASAAIRYLETGNTFSYAKCFIWYRELAGVCLPKIMEMPDKYIGETDIGYWDGFLSQIVLSK